MTSARNTAAARNFCFTLNNPSFTGDELSNRFSELDAITYAVWQIETGAEGTRHIQGYIELSAKKRYSYFAPAIAGAHFEPRRGTQKQARDYCMKEDTRVEGPWEYGTFVPKEKGSRTDLKSLKRKLDEAGFNETFKSEEHFGNMLRYHKGAQLYCSLNEKVRDRNIEPSVTMLFGQPGSGKTRYAFDTATAENKTVFVKDAASKWWDGYTHEDIVIIDEFNGWLPYSVFNMVLDRYPVKVEFKGGMRNMSTSEFYVISNYLPKTWYKEKCDIRAFARRVKKWGVFQKNPDGTIADPLWFDNYDDFDACTKDLVVPEFIMPSE